MSKFPPHFKRPLLLVNGLESDSTATFDGTANFNGLATFSSGIAESVQSLTGKSTGTEITNYGITKIICASGTESATAARWVYKIANPVPGIHKWIVVQADTTETVQVRTKTSTHVFFGSTFNALEWSTNGASTMGPPVAHLIGISTSQWLVDVLGSTDKITQQGATA